MIKFKGHYILPIDKVYFYTFFSGDLLRIRIQFRSHHSIYICMDLDNMAEFEKFNKLYNTAMKRYKR